MKVESLEVKEFSGFQVSLFRKISPNGRYQFLAETEIGDGDRVILDHWNLIALKRQLQEILPVVALVRRTQGG
jgi:hypothetical protein